MKLITFLVLFNIVIQPAIAQRSNVSKEETIDFLDKKSKEAVGRARLAINNSVFFRKQTLLDGYFRKTVTGVELYTKFGDEAANSFTYISFNPRHIVSVTDISKKNLTTESTIGIFEIIFVGKIALANTNGDSTSVDRAYFNFLQADPENSKKIVKAFLHLKDLYKADENAF